MELLAIPLLVPIVAGLVMAGLGHDLTDAKFMEELERERQKNANL